MTASQSTCRCTCVAVVGNPNTGKTTLFNKLTGYRQRVGNYPGVTVEKKTGVLKAARGHQRIELVDLPGTYSLAAQSREEGVVLDVLLGHGGSEAPDIIVVVLDATNLGRNLFLASQILETERPVIAALNMVDLAEADGIQIDAEVLSESLGIPVVPVVATSGVGIEALAQAIAESNGAPTQKIGAVLPECIQAEIDTLSNWLDSRDGNRPDGSQRFELLQALLAPAGYHEARLIGRTGDPLRQVLSECRARINNAGESLAEVEARVRYEWIEPICTKCTVRHGVTRSPKTETIDKWLTHRAFGLIVLLALMAACFQAVYTWSAPLMDAIDGTFGALGRLLGNVIPPGAIQSLVVNGAVAGVGAVLVFLPQILVLFLFLAILEDVGYLARAALLLDRWMGFLGLNGRSFIPLLSSFACAVPGIMATRVIEDRRDRLVTILIAPLMSCSARLPVYTLLISAFIPAVPLLGGLIGLQAVVLLSMYVVGVVVAVAIAVVLKKTMLPGKPQPFLIELPTYKWPSPATVAHRVLQQGKEFCASAGTIIFAVAVVIWALGYYPRPSAIGAKHDALRNEAQHAYQMRMQEIAASATPEMTVDQLASDSGIAGVVNQIDAAEKAFAVAAEQPELKKYPQAVEMARSHTEDVIKDVIQSAGSAGQTALALYKSGRQRDEALTAIDRTEAGAYLRQSILGRAGKWIEPIVRPIGWDWRIGTAVIASFPAREVVLATMGTIYNLGDDQDETSSGLRSTLHRVTWPDGRPVMNVAVALSLMVFFALCCQCGATLAVIKRETNSWGWPLFTFAYMTSIAYVAALLTYQVAVRFV